MRGSDLVFYWLWGLRERWNMVMLLWLLHDYAWLLLLFTWLCICVILLLNPRMKPKFIGYSLFQSVLYACIGTDLRWLSFMAAVCMEWVLKPYILLLIDRYCWKFCGLLIAWQILGMIIPLLILLLLICLYVGLFCYGHDMGGVLHL